MRSQRAGRDWATFTLFFTLQSRFLSTGPSGKPLICVFDINFLMVWRTDWHYRKCESSDETSIHALLRFFHCLWYQGDGFFHLQAMLTIPHGGLFPHWFVVFYGEVSFSRAYYLWEPWLPWTMKVFPPDLMWDLGSLHRMAWNLRGHHK